MSTKAINKVISFLTLVTFLVVIFVTGLVIRIHVSSIVFPTNEVSTIVVHDAYTAVSSTISWKVDQVGMFILDALKKAKALKLDEADKRNKISEVDLILFYVDEIISAHYPDLDAGLVKAIIYHESRYNPTCVNSKSGTTGLMQISPKWHTVRAKKLGVDDLKDPYGNILVGCDFLDELMHQYSYEYAINVYAGGYKYANRFKKLQSPIVKEFLLIKEKIEQGEIILGGE